MKKMLSLVVLSAALLQVGSVSALAVSKTEVKTKQDGKQKQNIRVGENARGQVIVSGLNASQVQNLINEIQAQSSASTSLTLTPIPF